jgi:hypothetical protein
MRCYSPRNIHTYANTHIHAAIRRAIRDELGLKENPPIVISAVMKDVQGTASKLGLPAEKSYLWDDNEVLKGQPHGRHAGPCVCMCMYEGAFLHVYLKFVCV